MQRNLFTRRAPKCAQGMRISVRRAIVRYRGSIPCAQNDFVVEEAAMRLYLNGVQYAEFTCSPWHLEELALGRLFLGGVIGGYDDVANVRVDVPGGRIDVETAHCGEVARSRIILFSHVQELRESVGIFREDSMRLARVSSSLRICAQDVVARIALLEKESDLFHLTGGVHAAALSDCCGVVARFEDVGRHNAVDKLAGWCVKQGVDASGMTMLFSGRVPQEIILKVIKLGCPIVVSPGAPTSLSVDLAETYGVTLVGFAKRGRFNVYSHAERISDVESAAL